MGRAPRTDDADRVLIALGQFAPDVENDRGIVNLPQHAGIFRRLRRDHGRAEVLDALQLSLQIDLLLPAGDFPGHVLTDALDPAQFALLRFQDAFRRFKNFEQFPQPHRPHHWEHVERDACLGVRHSG